MEEGASLGATWMPSVQISEKYHSLSSGARAETV
jgi:hypothetical protein